MELYLESLIVATDIGIVVLGITARFTLVFPAVTSFNKNANASEKLHCDVPYSSDANRNEKLKSGVFGWKSNSI